MKIFVLTDISSPYQVEFFNEIAAKKSVQLSVAYLRNADPNRLWQAAKPEYESWTMSESSTARFAAERAVRKADFAVFNYYNHPYAERLIASRVEAGGPWSFWGERPGLRQTKLLGEWFRKWKLRELRRSQAPIWGIGRFAIEQYRSEFGADRVYENLPYFSNLDRFAGEKTGHKTTRVFLFSGSLIERKGVDLLARAFVRLAREFPNVRLRIAGTGRLQDAIARTLRPVRERVEFAGFKQWNELPEMYASADVLCVPSRYDGWGLVVPEGLAAGMPVIATDKMGAALEFVRTETNGWLIRAGDEGALLDALREAAILPDPKLAQLGQHARQTVSEHTLTHGAQRFARYARNAVNKQ